MARMDSWLLLDNIIVWLYYETKQQLDTPTDFITHYFLLLLVGLKWNGFNNTCIFFVKILSDKYVKHKLYEIEDRI